MNEIIKILSLFVLIIIIDGCSTSTKQDKTDHVLDIFNQSYNHNIKNGAITDSKRIINADGKINITSSGAYIYDFLKSIKGDTFNLIKYDSLCSLPNKTYFLEIKKIDLRTDSCFVIMRTNCVYINSDSCEVGGMCGGSYSLDYKYLNYKWTLVEERGASF